jgi:transglutaminase-like putative cysteine protease
MPVFELRHVTTYRYARPVALGEHRLMLRPRDSHDLRLREALLTLSPPAAATRWQHDALGNSIAIIEFAQPTTELRIESLLRLEHFASDAETPPIASHARTLPFAYSADEIADLGRSHERHRDDPDHVVDAWARRFLAPPFAAEGEPPDTARVLAAMTRDVKASFYYEPRDAYGTRDPLETLRLGGTCRDFALLMMEAVRSLGLAARFVSGYLYDPARVAAGEATVGGGSTHAWVQVFLPGAGWVEYDPTNGTLGSTGLIRVAVTREPRQAVPISGTFTGAPGDALPMEVSVDIRRADAAAQIT